MASSSRATVVSDVWEFFREERRGKESKVQFVLQAADLPRRDYELT